MTPSHLTTLRLLAADEWNICREFREAVQAILAEREDILQTCRKICHSGCEPGKHSLALAILKMYGERPVEEGR